MLIGTLFWAAAALRQRTARSGDGGPRRPRRAARTLQHFFAQATGSTSAATQPELLPLLHTWSLGRRRTVLSVLAVPSHWPVVDCAARGIPPRRLRRAGRDPCRKRTFVAALDSMDAEAHRRPRFI